MATPQRIYRDDDVSHDDVSHELTGSAAARARMISRITGKPVELQRMDALERGARDYVDRAEKQPYPPEHGHALRAHAQRFDSDSDRKKGESGSAAARRRMLERIKANNGKVA